MTPHYLETYHKDMTAIRELKGLGPKSEKLLHEIGIFTREDLESTGVAETFLKLQAHCKEKVSLNFLYAMQGALDDIHWTAVTREQKAYLLSRVEEYEQIDAMFDESKKSV